MSLPPVRLPARPAALTTPGPNARRRRPLVIALLSVATALWLTAQLAAGVVMEVSAWPVAGFPMFSEKRTKIYERSLAVRSRSGRELAVHASDFGLTELQFLGYQRAMVSDLDMAKPRALDQLGRLAAVWSRAHPADPAVEITMTYVVRPAGLHSPAEPPRQLRWSAP